MMVGLQRKLAMAMVSALMLAVPCSILAPAAEAASKPITARIVAANAGGNMHVISGALGQLIEESIPGSRITVEPGESGGNPIICGSGESDIVTTMYSNASAAFKGTPPYPKVANVGGLANLGINQWIAFVSSNAKYKTLTAMLKDKFPMRLVLGAPGSTSEILIRQILEQYGVTYDMIRSWGGSVTHVSHNESVSLMKDNHADVYATIPSLRFPQLVDLTTSETVYFLPMDKEIIDAVARKHGYLTGSLPGGTYKNQGDAYYSLMETQLFLGNTKTLSEEDAYRIVKLLNENIQRLATAHSDIANFKPENAPKNTGFPLHPGADRYYREAGQLK